MTIRSFTLIAVVFVSAGSSSAYGEDIDPMIGHTSAGQLKAVFDWATPVELPPVDTLLHGWALDDPGFIHLDASDPVNDFFILDPGASIRFDVVSFSPAFKAWTPGFGTALHNPGDSFLFPNGDQLHTHFWWHIDSQDPQFDPAASPWTASFRFVDVGTTGYSPSDVYTLTFTPEPTAAALLGLGALLLGRRRGA